MATVPIGVEEIVMGYSDMLVVEMITIMQMEGI